MITLITNTNFSDCSSLYKPYYYHQYYFIISLTMKCNQLLNIILERVLINTNASHSTHA